MTTCSSMPIPPIFNHAYIELSYILDSGSVFDAMLPSEIL